MAERPAVDPAERRKQLWGGDPNIGGQVLLHIDEMVRGSAYVHGSLAGSLVKGSGGSDQGVQICLIF